MLANLSVDQVIMKAKSHAKKGEIEEAQKLYQSILKTFSKKADENNKRLNSSFKNFSIESSKALEKTMKKMSKNPIYNKIIANQSLQSQQINALIKKNNSLVSKMKDKAAMIKYP